MHMFRKRSEEGVSPVIAVILMVAITVVLAAVLFVMVQQYTEDTPGSLEAMTLSMAETTDGWLITITAGSIENNTELSYYVLNTTTGTPANLTVNWRDINGDNELSSGDTIKILDANHEYADHLFVINAGSNALEYTIKDY